MKVTVAKILTDRLNRFSKYYKQVFHDWKYTVERPDISDVGPFLEMGPP